MLNNVLEAHYYIFIRFCSVKLAIFEVHIYMTTKIISISSATIMGYHVPLHLKSTGLSELASDTLSETTAQEQSSRQEISCILFFS